MKRRTVLHLLLLAGSAPRAVFAQGFDDDERVREFINYLHEKHLFSPEELKDFFSRIAYDEKVLRLIGITKDGEKKKKIYWQQYRRQRLTEKKIVSGIKFYEQYETLLQKAEAQYGVPPAVITAIIGIETHYGQHTGKYPVAQTLATLGFGHPQRGQEFLDELVEFLLYARDTRIDPVSISGSYAGAIGMVQFMPSSIRKYAVDYDGNQRINLYDAPDAIASVGNFLYQHGWRRDIAGITYPARIQQLKAKSLIALTARNKYKAVMSIDELQRHGVETSPPVSREARYVFIDLENRYDTEYRIGNQNFYALTRYNRSFKYAAVVTDLAAKIQESIA